MCKPGVSDGNGAIPESTTNGVCVRIVFSHHFSCITLCCVLYVCAHVLSNYRLSVFNLFVFHVSHSSIYVSCCLNKL